MLFLWHERLSTILLSLYTALENTDSSIVGVAKVFFSLSPPPPLPVASFIWYRQYRSLWCGDDMAASTPAMVGHMEEKYFLFFFYCVPHVCHTSIDLICA